MFPGVALVKFLKAIMMLDCITKHFSSIIDFFLSNLILFDEAKTLEAETMNKRQLLILTVKEGKQTNTNTVKGTRTEKTTNMADHGHDSLVIITAIENKQNSFMSK